MIKLTGIGAFEACWRSLKTMYSINPHESQMLMQSMGRLVDNYASQSEIASELPLPLRKLFNLLVQSYLEGYWIEDETSSLDAIACSRVSESGASESGIAEPGIAEPSVSEPGVSEPVHLGAACSLFPARVAATQRRQRRTIQPTAASEADTCIIFIPSSS
ncbi:MAG: hypothetical protein AAF716_22930 [Cyanobacteria bacterium P01_D01_bin.1]